MRKEQGDNDDKFGCKQIEILSLDKFDKFVKKFRNNN